MLREEDHLTFITLIKERRQFVVRSNRKRNLVDIWTKTPYLIMFGGGRQLKEKEGRKEGQFRGAVDEQFYSANVISSSVILVEDHLMVE